MPNALAGVRCHMMMRRVEMTEQKSAVSILVEACADICDNYCKYPESCSSEDELEEHCERCPMNKIFE